MARTKTIEELKQEQKNITDLIRKKERELQDKALKKVASTFMDSLSKMTPEKMQEFIEKMKLSPDELGFVNNAVDKLKNKRVREVEEPTQTSSPTAPSNDFQRPANS